MSWLGYILKHKETPWGVLEGQICRKRGTSRSRITFIMQACSERCIYADLREENENSRRQDRSGWELFGCFAISHMAEIPDDFILA